MKMTKQNAEHEAYIETYVDIKADFCLTVKGDSMIGARIYDGDVVFVREQSIVDNGQIAVVIIDNIGEELNNIRCLGCAVSFMSNL